MDRHFFLKTLKKNRVQKDPLSTTQKERKAFPNILKYFRNS